MPVATKTDWREFPRAAADSLFDAGVADRRTTESELLDEVRALREEIAELRAERRPSIILTGRAAMDEWNLINNSDGRDIEHEN